MKKLFKIILLLLTIVISCSCIFACTNSENSNAQGLTFSLKFNEDGSKYYVVTGFVDDGSTSLAIPAEKNGIAVTTIKANIFNGNDKIVELTVPSSVTEIKEGAFAGMKALKKLTVPFIGRTANGDAYYNETEKAVDKSVDKARTFGYFFGESAFDYATEITSYYNSASSYKFYMPISLTEIVVNAGEGYRLPMYAFNGNTVIEKVTLSNSVAKIGDYAFANCSALKEVVKSESISYIGENAFENCSNLLG